MLKLKQVSQRLNCSLSNVYALVESGELAHTPVGANGKGIRVSEEQLKAFLAEREIKGGQEPAPRQRNTGPRPTLKHVQI